MRSALNAGVKGGTQARKRRTLARKKHEDCHDTGAKPFDYKRLVLMYSHFWRTYEQSAQLEKMEECDLFGQVGPLYTTFDYDLKYTTLATSANCRRNHCDDFFTGQSRRAEV